MYRRQARAMRMGTVRAAMAFICVGAMAASHAQDANAPGAAAELRQALAAAWARQPESAALQARRDAAQAQGRAASAWTPEAPALELLKKTDRFNSDNGAGELEVGVAVPLWLPAERSGSGALAQAEAAAVESRALAARWRTAGALRDAFWQGQRAAIEAAIADHQLDSARRLAADVARRVRAGDLARADQHQSDGAVAAAESSLAQARAALGVARRQWRSLAGRALVGEGGAVLEIAAEPEPPGAAAGPGADHPALRELRDRAGVAEHAARLASVRTRANPELTLATGRERDARGERYDRTVTLGLRIPFGSGDRQAARAAAAYAESTELEAQLALEQARVAAEIENAAERVQSARAQRAAAERRARLAGESRGFFDKAFRLGESDLPTRLRVEAEAVEAERQAARSRIELASAISQWRQALGLLPE